MPKHDIPCSLESHSLSHKLSWLLSDKEHLLSCLEPWAFLCQENLAEATLLYLRAVERNQPVLLAEIDPCLVSNISSFVEFHLRVDGAKLAQQFYFFDFAGRISSS